MLADRIYQREALAHGLIIPFDKPESWTSFDVVNKVRRLTGVKKVGHAGTLDPFATGVLVVCFGKATKRVEQLMKLEKEYRGVIQLGVETNSHDVTGAVVQRTKITAFPGREKVNAVLSKFHGEIQQVPPMHSALKIKGERLYRLARKGKTVEREPRLVHIRRITLLDLRNDVLEIEVVCSKGTYIRALARDIGRALGVGGYLKSLMRTRVGFYTLENAHNLVQFEREFKAHNS